MHICWLYQIHNLSLQLYRGGIFVWGIIAITIIVDILVVLIGSFLEVKSSDLSTLATAVTMCGLFLCVVRFCLSNL